MTGKAWDIRCFRVLFGWREEWVNDRMSEWLSRRMKNIWLEVSPVLPGTKQVQHVKVFCSLGIGAICSRCLTGLSRPVLWHFSSKYLRLSMWWSSNSFARRHGDSHSNNTEKGQFNFSLCQLSRIETGTLCEKKKKYVRDGKFKIETL